MGNYSVYRDGFSWLFSIQGILVLILIGAIIYFVWKLISEKKSDSLNMGISNNNKYNYEMGTDESFWEGFKQEEKYPKREEEPVPPNAIPPVDSYNGQNFEEMKEKDKVTPLDEPVQEIFNEENK